MGDYPWDHTGDARSFYYSSYGIDLSPEVVLWEPLWVLNIYYITTWSLWVANGTLKGLGFRVYPKGPCNYMVIHGVYVGLGFKV